ncbi:MAG: hypothetical protein LW832_03965 [Parachlamydia sp.]|jgi:hypothetical protein|nr:hypothetical protein [Parachlamydia sp.]
MISSYFSQLPIEVVHCVIEQLAQSSSDYKEFSTPAFVCSLAWAKKNTESMERVKGIYAAAVFNNQLVALSTFRTKISLFQLFERLKGQLHVADLGNSLLKLTADDLTKVAHTCPCIKTLKLSLTSSLNDEGAARLHQFRNLKNFSFYGTSLSKEGYEFFSKMSQLENLEVILAKNLTQEGAKKLSHLLVKALDL